MKALAVKLFGPFAEKNASFYEALKVAIYQADMSILAKTYFAICMLAGAGGFLATFFVLMIALPIAGYGIFSILLALGGAIVGGGVGFGAAYAWPFYRAVERRRNIESNLPFATNHMAAITSSGVPPVVMFRLLTGFDEYGEISRDSKKIIRNVDAFGQDLLTSMKSVASKSPSDSFQELLLAIAATIETGGDLKLALKERAEKALFEYRIKREKYIETLSLYADFYTALLIAAPLFLVALLAIISLIGGSLGGLTIPQIINIGVYLVIPLVNVIFLTFIHITQPEI